MKFVRKKSKLKKLGERVIAPLTGRHQGHRPDYILLIAAAIIVFFGLLMLSSATSVIGFDRYHDSYYFVKQQLLRGLLPGLFLFFVLIRIHYTAYRKYGVLLLVAVFVLLGLVFVPGLGISINNARSWISVADLTIQTSEIAKLFFVLYMAHWLDKKQKDLTSATKTFIPFLIILGLTSVLLILQPDMGTMMIFVLTAAIMFFISGMRLTHFFGLIILGTVTVAAMIKAAPYRLARFTSFLNPEADPQGAGYQLQQALIAIGSGGLLGLGLGHSRQKFEYLPEVAADSIFAIMGEELGLVFSLLFITLYLIIFLRGIQIARNAPDLFGKLLASGITAWIVVQSFINIGAIMGILPLTGLPLPFVSLGGTNLAILFGAVALLVNISKYTKSHE